MKARAIVALALAVLLPCGVAHAEASWEETRTRSMLETQGVTLEPAPEGKRIAFVRIVRDDVFAQNELVPTFFNMFHALTREDIVRDEVLFAEGESYDTARVEETARNLRRIGIFNLVRVVPVRTERAEEVGVVVYTRDLWSLRAEQRLQLNDGQIDTLTLQLTELNLAGRAKRLTGRFNLTPFEWAGGLVYIDRRLGGGSLLLLQSADLIFNRETNALEGGQALLRLEDPFRDLSPQWGFASSLYYDERISRQVSGGVVLAWDDPRTAEVEAIPREWDQRTLSVVGLARHQMGKAVVHQAGFGAGVSDFSTDGRYRNRPEARRRLYPVVTYGGFVPRWRTYRDLGTFGLSEDVRLGPSWNVRLAAPLGALGSTTTATELSAGVSVVEAFAGDGLTELAVAGEAVAERTGYLGQVVYLRARGASPTLGIGRLVLRADAYLRRTGEDQRSGTLVTLGGDNGLRGYPSQAFFGFGDNLARGSFEWRTRPVEWASVHLGGLLFYDVGSVYPTLEDAEWHHSVGFGLRFLMPQFNRYAYRLDAGFPLEGGFMVRISAGSHQSVPLTETEDELYEHFVGGLSAQPDGPRGILQ
jgi:hypothetical protein